MISLRTFIASVFIFIFSVWSVSAQGQCALDVSAIVERVNNECANIGENQVCYGNRNVDATFQLNLPGLYTFENPGDLVDLYNIQSLVVDAVDPSTDTWGVAQMRLLVGSDQGEQDITMLHFGEFDIENAVEDTPELDLIIQTNQKNIYLAPDTESAVVERVEGNTILTGIARLADTSWIRVENPVTRRVGWIDTVGVEIVNEALSTGILPIREPDSPYFGAMQAFYFQSGQTDLGCDTVESDGLLIQTPEGEARISLLINEVSVELTSGFNDAGERESGTALIQANPLAGREMSINVLSGNATVETTQGRQEVTSGERSAIPLTVDLRSPAGAPQPATESTVNTVSVAPLLPAVSAPREVASASSNNSGGSGNNSTNNSGSGGSTGGSSSGGINVQVTTGNGSGTDNTSSSSTTGGNNNNSSNNSSSGGFGFGNNNNNSNNNNSNNNDSDNAPSTFQNTNDDDTANDRDQFGFGAQGNIIALGIAIAIMIAFALFIVRSARNQR